MAPKILKKSSKKFSTSPSDDVVRPLSDVGEPPDSPSALQASPGRDSRDSGRSSNSSTQVDGTIAGADRLDEPPALVADTSSRVSTPAPRKGNPSAQEEEPRSEREGRKTPARQPFSPFGRYEQEERRAVR